uniref:Plant heme peroxidase family profile domain-containing protein n=1 Tax=Oryza punctata TaxID=4537 RepID=A0A0E0JHF4_ORYPU
MRLSVAILCALVAVQAALLLAGSAAEASELKVGYYNKKCKGVENVIKWHVIKALKQNRRTGAALVRLLFHDCFVRAANPDVVNNVRDEELSVVARFMPGFVSRVRKISDFLDNTYYHNNLAKIVTFHSDWQLLTDKESLSKVHEYADNATLWDSDFSDSLLKLSQLPMPEGSKGEIRKKCSSINHMY